jgi:hypothetical protein
MCRSSRGITSECRSCACRIYSQVSILRCRRSSKHLSKDIDDRSFIRSSSRQSHIRAEDEKFLGQTETNDSSVVAVGKRKENRLLFFTSLIGLFDLQSRRDLFRCHEEQQSISYRVQLKTTTEKGRSVLRVDLQVRHRTEIIMFRCFDHF